MVYPRATPACPGARWSRCRGSAPATRRSRVGRPLGPEELRAHLPELGEESLLDRPLQVARAERATGPAGGGSDNALDELHVLEPPLRKALLVLEERLGEEEEHRRSGPDVQLLERRTLGVEQPKEEVLERRPVERATDRRRRFAVLLDHVHEVLVA